jgi:hypothetical protein
MQFSGDYPTDTFNYHDPEINNLGRRMVFETKVEGNFSSESPDTKIEELVVEIANFLLGNLGKTILVETTERIARVLCMKLNEEKWGLIAFVNLKSNLSPYETQSWTASVTPQFEKIEWHLKGFLLTSLYGDV